VMYQCLSTMVISNQSFTSAAVALAERHKCLLIDGSELSRFAEGWHPEARKDRFAKEEESVVSGARRGKSERAEEISVLGRFRPQRGQESATSWRYEKRCCTKTTRSDASTSYWASCAAVTGRRSP
jgi:hypothetical protein